MSEPRLSSATKALLRAAKTEAPSAAARAKMWSGVSSAVGGAAGAAGAAGGGSAAGASAVLAGGGSAAKMLAIGTLLGGTVTVGLASVLLGIGPAPTVPPVHASVPVAAAAAPPRTGPGLDGPLANGSFVRVPDLALVGSDGANAPPVTGTAASPTPVAPTGTAPVARIAAPPRPAAPPPTSVTLDVDRLLAQEVALVADARSALDRGDPKAALVALKAARALPSHRLAPEELAVEAQALRALGREDDARDNDSTLKKQFPESALGL